MLDYRLLLMTSVQLCICDPLEGHLRSYTLADPGGQPDHAPQAQDRGHHVFWPQKLKHFYFYLFFESEFRSIPKNSVLNPWSFQFWGYPTLGPRAKLPPPPLKPAAGSASSHIMTP